MYIRKIDLKNFRNYNNSEINFSNGINVIFGKNGQGKTNIVEAINISCTGKSHRRSKDIEMVQFGNKNYFIHLYSVVDKEDLDVEILFKKDKGKMIKINEIPMKKYSDLIGRIKVVIFAPDDLGVIKDGPSERRNFLDNAISQVKPYYLHEINSMIKILANKNALLKTKRDINLIKQELDIWNEQLAKIFVKIIRERFFYINKLSEYAKIRCAEISGNQEIMSIKYKTMISEKEIFENNKLEYKIYDIIDKGVQEEIRRNSILFGVHRDELKIFINDKEVKTYGSQGQQRTSALSLKLAEMDIINDEFLQLPILILDDVMSELDENRRNYLIETIKKGQVFITCTEENIVPKIIDQSINYINVDKGEISCFCI